jgi:hypothetical protein
VAHNLHQTDEVLLVSRQLQMSSGERAAEERDGSGALVEHNAEPDARRVAVDDEELVEVACLSVWNASSASLSQAKASRRRKRVSGAAMRPKLRMNFL